RAQVFAVCCAWTVLSRRPLRSPARLLSERDVKKLRGLSSAELTRLPVAKRVWIALVSAAVPCSDRSADRTPADKVTPDIERPRNEMFTSCVLRPDERFA